jgi:hypothetical protein
MNFQQIGYVARWIVTGFAVLSAACQKTGSIRATSKPVSLTLVNVIPGSEPVIPVLNTSSYNTYYSFANRIGYGNFTEYSPPGGEDTTFVVQMDDTLNVGPKSGNTLFYNILDLQPGSIHSLFLTGADTSSPDFLLTTDSIPFYESEDSVVGIRFVNLSTGSSPISVNLEGSSNGSEVTSLPYKGITSFKQYANNSTTQDYLFVVRDVSTGDSLTQFDFLQTDFFNNGYGLIDPYTYEVVTFKNVTIVIYGSEANGSAFPLSTILVENY